MGAKGPLKKLYDHGPVWLQNIMVSGYGWQRHHLRYGGEWRKWVDFFMESQYWSAEQFEAYQLQRLQQLVRHSMKHVPYYRDTYGALGIVPEEITDIKQLPFLEKDTLRTQLERCTAQCWPRNKLLEFHTSGSTGTPLTYFMEREDFRERMAQLERQRRWAGVREGDRVVSFGGSLIVPEKDKTGPTWRHNWFGHQLVVSSYHLSPQNLPGIVDKMAHFRPKIIEGYPSALYVVARWLEQHGKPESLQPIAILATAETLHDYQRQTIQDVFGTRVYNYYGSSEAAPLITEHPDGFLYVNPESGIFEFLLENGTDAAPGETAEMVVTSFQTRAMPLIRYRIRDAAIPDYPPSPDLSTLQMPRVRTIIGRMDDMIYTSDRGWIGRLSQAVKVFPGSIREAQIVQYHVDEIVIRLVPDPDLFDESQLELLFADLRKRIGTAAEIRIEYVNSIERGPNNKFKYVVNALPDDEKSALQMRTHSETVG
ncbi:MAG: hypothetical protein M9928_03435 [Anaerolineae bacterium]|nr:hypothetical protein [Anaerolineae bacterium]MCO5200073.1 hypothetical protein [Anaerolineae bacterium]MCO5204058.1 hypothetical protein [Anaerolineae bacterium]